MHPVLPRPVQLERPPLPRTATKAGSRGGQHRALPVRRVPQAPVVDGAVSAAVLQAVVAGLQAVPDRVVVPVRRRLLDAVVERWNSLDHHMLRTVVGAGAGAAVVFTVVLLLWLASAGRLG